MKFKAETVSDHILAIVIPAFKPDYLAKSLSCLVRQTDQRFKLYICDDASPADIEGITRSTLGARSYVYKRFESNLGGKSLSRHWDRCVALSGEEWVWLFSDDDMMDDNCVEAFYNFLETKGKSSDVLHFDLWEIDEQGKLIRAVPPYLDQETWLEFAYRHVNGWRVIAQQNLVFKRSAFDKVGGFLDTPLCWWGDAAIAVALARHKPIRSIRDACVFWRRSQQNINGNYSIRAKIKKLQAACLYLRWLQRQLETPRDQLFPDDSVAFRRAMDRFLVTEVVNDGFLPAMVNWKLLSRTRAEVCHGSRWALLKYVAMAIVNDIFSVLQKSSTYSTGLFKRRLSRNTSLKNAEHSQEIATKSLAAGDNRSH